MTETQKTILIVDDEPDIVLALSAILEDEGYTVVSAGKGDDLTRYLDGAQSPDLILLDMPLSGRHGADILRELEQRQNTRHIPVVMLSAHPDAEQEARTVGAGGPNVRSR